MERAFGDVEERREGHRGEHRIARAQEELTGLAVERDEAEGGAGKPTIMAFGGRHQLSIAVASQRLVKGVYQRQLEVCDERHRRKLSDPGVACQLTRHGLSHVQRLGDRPVVDVLGRVGGEVVVGECLVLVDRNEQRCRVAGVTGDHRVG